MEYDTYNHAVNNFDECIKCTICTAYCPVSEVNPLYPGPKQAGPDGERYRLKKSIFYDDALKYCLNCKRCEVACPSNIKIGDIILSARLRYDKPAPKLRDRLLANTDLIGALGSATARLTNRALSLKPVKSLLDSTLGIDCHRSFPAYSGLRFSQWFKRIEPKQREYAQSVAYFHGCYVEYNYPQLGQDLVKVLNAVGIGVKLLPDERCCGVAKLANGLETQARRDAEANLAAIRAAGTQVIATSSTCAFTMRDEYPHVLGIDNTDVREQIYLATRYLYNLVESESVKLVFREDFHRRVAYHTPCHMAKMGWCIFSLSLLKTIPGLELVALPQLCCGIAGTYGFKKENYPYSQRIGQHLFDEIDRRHPDLVVTDCETCKWQIEMSTNYKVVNPISIIADALDYEKTYNPTQYARNPNQARPTEVIL